MNSSSIYFSYNWEYPWSFKHSWNCKIQPLILQQIFCRCTMTHAHEFTELNKNLRRIKVSLVWCLGKDWACTVTARGKEPWGTPSRSWAHPTSPARERTGWGAARAPPAPQPGVFAVTHQVWGTAGKSASQGQVTVRQRWDKAGDKVTYHLYGDSPKDWAEMGSTLMPFILHWALHKTRQLDNSKAVYYPNILELKVLKRMNSIACHAGSYCSVCVHSTQQVWKCRFYDIPCSSVTNHSADLDSMQILKNLGCSY